MFLLNFFEALGQILELFHGSQPTAKRDGLGYVIEWCNDVVH